MARVSDTLTAEIGDLQARRAAEGFHTALEGELKKYKATSFILAASSQLVDVQEGRASLACWRPHDLIHAIEAMCAYRRGHRSICADQRALARVMNVYVKHEDPYTSHLLSVEQSVHLAFRTMAMQQFAFQYWAHYRDVARAYSIFG
jgi:hypothetical protein